MITADGKAPPPLRVAWLVWGLGALFYLMAFFQRVAPAVMTDALMRDCLLYTSPSPRDGLLSRMPSSA